MSRKIGVVGILLFVLCGAFFYLVKQGARESFIAKPVGRLIAEPNRPLSDFKEWAVASSGDLDEGIALAKKHGVVMQELIRTDPERALREALSLSEWSALSPEVQAHVEQPFSALANVEVLISCGEGFSETTITTEFPTTGTIETFVYGRRSGLGSKNGTPVQGIRMGGVGALREDIFQSLDAADEAAALSLYPVAVADPGGGSIAALAGGRVFYFKNRAALDEANARLAVLEELPGPNAGAQALFQMLEEESAIEGEIDFEAVEEIAIAASMAWTGSPRDMYVILVDFSDVPGQPTDPVALSNSVNTAVSQQVWDMSHEKTHIICTVNPTTYRMPETNEAYTNNSLLFTHATNAVAGVDLSPYETVCVFHPPITGETYAGLASVGGSKMWLKSASVRVITHELGHNYGSRHASSWAVPGSDPVDPSGTPTEYGDFTDIMGSGAVPAGHFNAWHKRHIGWLDADNWQSVTTSGTYRIYRSDHRETSGLLQGLEIDKGGSDEYWVGLRQRYGSYDTYSRGAYLLWKKSGDNRSYLLDTTPQSSAGKEDGGLALGQTYSDEPAAVHITPTARGGQTPNEWMDITVNLGSFPGNTAPTASLAGPANLAVQESALFSVTASDADGDELAYFWDIGDGLVKANSSSLSVTWLSGSTVTVNCMISDMKGGTITVSKNVVLSSALENWTPRTSGATEDLYSVAEGGGRLVAVGSHGTTYSDDGTSWTFHNDGTPWMGNAYLRGVIHDGAQFLACGMNYHSGWVRSVFTSPNGTHWTERYTSPTSAGNTYFYDMAYGNGVYVAVGSDGNIARSTNGTSWNSVSSGITTNLRGIAYGDGTFVAVGADNSANNYVVLTSTNGVSWIDHTAGVTLDSWKGLFDVRYCNDRFLAGGFYARILHSTNQGATFSTLMTGDRYRIPAFAYGDGTYFAAGINKDDGNADINLISLDGANWTELATDSQADRNAAVFYNGTFITVGAGGAIWQSDAAGSTEPGFANWQLENGEALGFDRDPRDDADFDGSLNLAEYAMGTTATDAGSLPSSTLDISGSYFQISYGRDGIKGDIDYLVERATNLLSNDWSTADTAVVIDHATNLTVRSAIPMDGQTNEFLRLKVELK